MQTVVKSPDGYWKSAAKVFSSAKMLSCAAVVCALRIAVKALHIQIAPGVYFSFDCYVNSVGALIYGPLMGLLVGAVSDTVGAVLFPSGAYFFPFIVVEMLSAFIFGLFFWKRKIDAWRAILAKFTVSFVCNIVVNSLIMKWYYALFFTDKVYPIINGVRIAKNLILFPLEGVVISVLLGALLPAFKAFGLVNREQQAFSVRKKDILAAVLLAVAAVGLVLFYIFFLKDFIAEHNFKLY
ncbi:MAG: folate family ECF transporter S component [Firmicutes bacterium]|nr:folate family ECF transporter S component [Bacillota bacterium]